MKRVSQKIFIMVILAIVIISFISFYALNSSSQETSRITPFAIKEINSTDFYGSANSDASQYYPNMRFASRNLSYWIESNCNDFQSKRMENAFLILENKTKILKFNRQYPGDIEISCNKSPEENQEFVKAGEGGAVLVIDTGNFNVIKKGKITLFPITNSCYFPQVEIHELLHVLGFKHSNNTLSIMYPISNCNQEISLEIIGDLVRTYGAEELPDLDISEINISRNIEYLNFQAKIVNRGLSPSKKCLLEVYFRDKKVNSFQLGKMNYGEGKLLNVENLFVSNYDSLKFIISSEEEISTLNNEKEIKI